MAVLMAAGKDFRLIDENENHLVDENGNNLCLNHGMFVLRINLSGTVSFSEKRLKGILL